MDQGIHSPPIYSFHCKFGHKLSVGLRHENIRWETRGPGD